MGEKKTEFLRKEGLLNRKPERVCHPLFDGLAFFDPLDLPQVRYEMLRVARVEGRAVSEACRTFGFSREYFYRQERAFMERGFVALLGSPMGRRPVIALNQEVLNFITPYIEQNTLGVKTGAGFYSYPQPKYQDEDFLAECGDLSAVSQALVCVLIAHAVVIARDDIAEPRDIDRAWMASMSLGTGPFGALDEMGIDTFLESCSSLVERGLFSYGLSQQVASYLQPYVESNHLGGKSGQGFYHYPEPEFRSPDFIVNRV